MKKVFMLFVTVMIAGNLCVAQEWMSSLDVAKRLAFVQDKMIIMVWEEAAIKQPYLLKREGEYGFVNLFESDYIDEIFWKNFVPVIVNENMYGELYEQIVETKDNSYINMFNNDDIKILDINGKILGTYSIRDSYFDLERFVYKYALNTSFLKDKLKNYREEKSFYSSFRLASKYLDFSILVNNLVREEVINLSEVYLKEADAYLLKSDIKQKEAFMQKSKLLKLKIHLILNKPQKTLRKLKKFKNVEVAAINQSLLAFLHYTSYKLIKAENEAMIWKSKVSSVDLKFTDLILNINSL